MSIERYSDLLIIDGALSLDVGAQPALTNTRSSIAQDIKHQLLESGLVTKLLAQRSATLRADVYTEIELLVETDVRLVPGSIALNITDSLLILTANTYEFGSITTEVSNDTTTS